MFRKKTFARKSNSCHLGFLLWMFQYLKHYASSMVNVLHRISDATLKCRLITGTCTAEVLSYWTSQMCSKQF